MSATAFPGFLALPPSMALMLDKAAPLPAFSAFIAPPMITGAADPKVPTAREWALYRNGGRIAGLRAFRGRTGAGLADAKAAFGEPANVW